MAGRAGNIILIAMIAGALLGVLGGALGFVAGVMAAIYFSTTHEETPIRMIDMNLSWAVLFLTDSF